MCKFIALIWIMGALRRPDSGEADYSTAALCAEICGQGSPLTGIKWNPIECLDHELYRVL